MRKILFLDFDGVLHPSHFKEGSEFSRVRLLEDVFLNFNCKILISSSWRFHYPISDLKEKLGRRLSEFVVGSTDDAFQGQYARYHEILEWLNFRGLCDWRAIDDSAFEFPAICGNLILCDSRIGIDISQIKTLTDWLKF